MMSDLVEFLRVRLDEDEAYALTVDPSLRYYAMVAAQPSMDGYPRHYQDQHATDLMHRYDPARVLREVEAKRRIVHELTTERHVRKVTDRRGVYETVVEAQLLDSWEAEVTVKALAAIYSEHPDYRDEWKP